MIKAQDITTDSQLSSPPQFFGDRQSIMNNDLLDRRGLTTEQYVILNELALVSPD